MSESMNPKMEGSNCIDCRPQVGECPNGCSQCFYNRPGAFYCDINKPQIPHPDDVGDKVVRMNSGHDSNLEKEKVLDVAAQYPKVFFNTSIPNFDFPGPVVFTANAKEEEPAWCPIVNRPGKTRQIPARQEEFLDRLMFVRLRVSPTNLELIEQAVACWTAARVPVVLTFMAYYDQEPPGCLRIDSKVNRDEPPHFIWYNGEPEGPCKPLIDAYCWKKRHINPYYCPTRAFMFYTLQRMKKHGGTLVTMCGTPDSVYCRDCNNCRNYYEIRAKHLAEKGTEDV
jgi:hypothetical protein